MKSNNQEIVKTTLGELIETLSEAAFGFSNDQKKTYLLASLALDSDP